MSYRLTRKETVAEGICRIAGEQVAKAIREVEDDDLDPAVKVHQVRKRCKKMRGLVRLVRPSFESTYQAENAWHRDTARQLSEARDAKSMIATYDLVMEHYAEQLNRQTFGSIRRELTLRHKLLVRDQVDVIEKLDEAQDRMYAARDRIKKWTLDEEGFDAIAPGLEKTYRRAREAMQAAFDAPSPEAFHEWRKRVKYHWYHCRLLKNIWPDPMDTRQETAHTLSNWLGDDHDLAVIHETVADEPDAFGDLTDIETFSALITQRRTELQADCQSLGERLFAESEDRLSARFGACWETWRARS